VTVTTTPVRRTQAERRATSRARLVEAALTCLAERGYAGATLPEIVRQAGMSNGALWRHFPSKAELLAATSFEAERRLLATATDLPATASPAARIDAVVGQVARWSEQPAMFAILELLVASRTDDELRRELREGDERASAMFVNEIHRLLGPDLAAHPHFRANVRQLGLTMYGMAVTQHLRTRSARGVLLDEIRDLGRRLFDLG
jgi:AcrR family transcriptional regulator